MVVLEVRLPGRKKGAPDWEPGIDTGGCSLIILDLYIGTQDFKSF